MLDFVTFMLKNAQDCYRTLLMIRKHSDLILFTQLIMSVYFYYVWFIMEDFFNERGKFFFFYKSGNNEVLSCSEISSMRNDILALLARKVWRILVTIFRKEWVDLHFQNKNWLNPSLVDLMASYSTIIILSWLFFPF